MYKVVFKGRLREGFSKETVIDNIVRLTKIPEQKIQQKFFSGKAVIIRRAHDLVHAQKLQQLFTQAGLEVIILKDETVKIAQQKLAEQQQTEKNSKKKQRKSTKTPLTINSFRSCLCCPCHIRYRVLFLEPVPVSDGSTRNHCSD